jgi:hypothetical protein
LSHETLVAIAGTVAGNEPIETLLPRHFSPRRKDGLWEAIQKGLASAPRDHPEILRFQSRRHTESQRQRFISLEGKRNARATELNLDPTLIASRAILLALADNWDQGKSELMNWQRDLLQ